MQSRLGRKRCQMPQRVLLSSSASWVELHCVCGWVKKILLTVVDDAYFNPARIWNSIARHAVIPSLGARRRRRVGDGLAILFQILASLPLCVLLLTSGKIFLQLVIRCLLLRFIKHM